MRFSARKNSRCSLSCHIDNGNSIRACRAKGQSFRAAALLLYALQKQSRKTGKKAPSGKDDAVFEKLFLFVRFGIEVIELFAVKSGLFVIVEGRDGNFSAAGAIALSAC